MIKLGNMNIPDGAWLAPMAGVTDLPFRLLCREQGCAMMVSEMVSAKGFLCAPENQRAVQALLAHAPQEGNIALQLFGHEPDVMAEAAARLSDIGFSAIDINMGCPAPKITGGGEGSALLRDLPLAGRIVAAVRHATHLPVMVKMRLGWDGESLVAVELARMAEAEGADLITVHGRTRMQFYAGRADWNAIARVKAAVRIPVIGNGDIDTAEQAEIRMCESGCDGVMIGRGALGNPWVFAQVQARLAGLPEKAVLPQDRVQVAVRHARMLMAWKGEAVAIREMRKHGAWYARGMHGASKMRTQVQSAATLGEFEAAMGTLLAE